MKKLSRNEWIAVTVSILFVGYTLFGGEIMSVFNRNSMNQNSGAVSASQNHVMIKDVEVGGGDEVRDGELLTVNYILSLTDGTVIQNSKDFGRPFQFTLGAGQVIPGWEQGLAGMRVGGVRTIVIPPEFGYGARTDIPKIPANSTLVFTIELLDASDIPPVE